MAPDARSLRGGGTLAEGKGVGLGGGLGWVIWVVSGGKVAKKHYKKDN